VQGSEIGSRALQGGSQTRRSLQAVSSGAESDPFGAVLALLVGELARSWTKQSRKRARAYTKSNPATLRPASEKGTWTA
jgi:hypothetical protein